LSETANKDISNIASARKEIAMKNAEFTLEVLEPHGRLAFPERRGLSAPRLSDLNGIKIAIMAMGPDSLAFFETIKSMLKNKYPAVEFVHFSYGMPQNGSDMRHMVVIHPTFARQLANAGFTRESFIKWLHDKNSIRWDKMSEDERKDSRELVAEGKVKGIRTEDCKPGLYREPFTDPKDVAVIVAGTGAGGVMAGIPMTCSLIVGGRLTDAQIQLAELLLKNNPAEKTNAFCLFLYDISNSGKILEMLILGPKYSFMGPGCGKDKAAGHRQFVFNRQIAAGHHRKWFPCLPV
jgi:hypothetical protein